MTELNRQGSQTTWNARRHNSRAPTSAGKLVAIQFVQKRQGPKFVSPLDCEGNGHFQEQLVTLSHVYDDLSGVSPNERIPSD